MNTTGGPERLHHLYVNELRSRCGRRSTRRCRLRQTEELIRQAERLGPGTAATADAATWIRSDLHLGHEPSRIAFRRPFASAAEADEAMMNAWYERVGDNESIISLGDVSVDGDALAHHQEWWGGPGSRWLLLRNHDVDP